MPLASEGCPPSDLMRDRKLSIDSSVSTSQSIDEPSGRAVRHPGEGASAGVQG